MNLNAFESVNVEPAAILNAKGMEFHEDLLIRSKKEFQGSIVKHIERVMEYYEVCNEVRVIIDGKPTRTEIPSYDMSSAREAILNCYCHRDFSRKLNIKIEFFDDRCEIISPSVFF